MDKMTKKIIGAFAVIVVVAAAIIGVYYFMNEQAEKKAQKDLLPTTETGKLLAKDLDTKYPETPTEVLKLYWRLNRCMYNEEMNEKTFEKLYEQLRKLYDEEFLAQEGNSYDDMLAQFRKDKESSAKKDQTISACVVQENKKVTVKELDGRECATVITSSLIKVDGKMTRTYEQFICRRDSKKKWRILGWQQTDEKEASKVGVK